MHRAGMGQHGLAGLNVAKLQQPFVRLEQAGLDQFDLIAGTNRQVFPSSRHSECGQTRRGRFGARPARVPCLRQVKASYCDKS